MLRHALKIREKSMLTTPQLAHIQGVYIDTFFPLTYNNTATSKKFHWSITVYFDPAVSLLLILSTTGSSGSINAAKIAPTSTSIP